MNLRTLLILVAAGFAALPLRAIAARSSPEVHPPQRRAAAVALAEQIAKILPVAPLPGDMVSPFAPPDFDKPDPAELQAALLAAQRSAASGAVQKKSVSIAAGDRETLEKLAAQIQPSGAMQMRGIQRLLINGKAFEVGTRFTATYNNLDYELELSAIDRTTFTLRYRGEEITRPIKTVR
ncbi:MAG: hypothetical protein Q8N18_23470 [Opitutaceae bacterium]|nr:hypothetical protein [Opitutaceae bacterium]